MINSSERESAKSTSKSKRIFLSPPHMSGSELSFIEEAIASNYVAPLGPMVDAFEREFSEKTGFSHVLAVSSGTAAMHLAARTLGVGPGDEVLVSSLTFIGSVSSVIFQGASPVFIDSDRATWNMDPDLLAEEIYSRRRSGVMPKAVIPTDIYGQSCHLDRILDVCKPYNIPVIVDSAEALGAIYKGRHAGVGGAAAVYSFNGNKIITTSGGGMLASDDPELINQARFLSQQARDPAPYYQHSQIGYNYRMSNILAAIGRSQLSILDERVKRKREIFEYYKAALADLPGIDFMPEPDYARSTRWLTVILVDPADLGIDNESIRLALENENIESRHIWKPMHLQPVFASCEIRGGDVSEEFFRKGLCLPSGTAMTDADLEKVVTVIKKTAKKN